MKKGEREGEGEGGKEGGREEGKQGGLEGGREGMHAYFLLTTDGAHVAHPCCSGFQ